VSDFGGSYVKDAMYTKIKESGKSILNSSEITKDVIDKIKQYVPNPKIWED